MSAPRWKFEVSIYIGPDPLDEDCQPVDPADYLRDLLLELFADDDFLINDVNLEPV